MQLIYRFTLGVIALALLTISPLNATTIIPFPNLGEMASASTAVVMAEVTGQFEVTAGEETRWMSRLVVRENVKGPLPVNSSFDIQHLSAKGNGWVRVIPDDIKLESGKRYLLFLHPFDNYWRPLLLSYGVFEEHELNGAIYLAPIPEGLNISLIPRPDGVPVEPTGVYYQDDLLELLKAVTTGAAEWNNQNVLVTTDVASFLGELTDRVAPSFCTFLNSGGNGFRWLNFPGTALPVHYPNAGDAGCSTPAQANTNVQNAITDLTANYAGINVTNGGTYSGFTPDCSGGSAVGGNFTSWVNANLGGSRHVVIQYQDPCSQITDLSNCSGTLAIGGTYGFTPFQSYDGLNWYQAAYGYVVVNNGVCSCLTSEGYKIMITHELTHTLGLGHITGNGTANMNPSCCINITGMDESCVDYLYAPLLPVELISFSAKTNAQNVALTWRTASELNNDFFTVERSADGVNYFPIVKMAGAGTTHEERSYQYLDEHPVPGSNYYRLKQTDFDGAHTYSQTVSAMWETREDVFEVFPNPTDDGQINLAFTVEAPGEVQVEIFSSEGRLVAEEVLKLEAGYQQQELELSDVPAGIYLAKMTQQGEVSTVRFIKE